MDFDIDKELEKTQAEYNQTVSQQETLKERASQLRGRFNLLLEIKSKEKDDNIVAEKDDKDEEDAIPHK